MNIGIDPKERYVLAHVLSKLLADSHFVYLKTQGYHWKPFKPSTQAMKMSCTPRFLSSVTTYSQNLAPSVCAIHMPSNCLFVLAVPKVFGHLGFKRTFDQSFDQLLEKPVFSNEVFRLFVIRQQTVYQFVAYTPPLATYESRIKSSSRLSSIARFESGWWSQA
jgi:hypothetical protein